MYNEVPQNLFTNAVLNGIFLKLFLNPKKSIFFLWEQIVKYSLFLKSFFMFR